MFLIPTVLAIGYTGSITGEAISSADTEVIGAPEAVETPLESEAPEQTETLTESPPEPQPEPQEESPEEIPEPETEPPEEPSDQPVQPETPPEEQTPPEEPEPLEAPTEPEQPESVQNETEPEPPKEAIPEPEINETNPEDPTEPEINETKPVAQPGNNATQPTQPYSNETNTDNETQPTDPEIPMPEVCNITCGYCEILNQANCTCLSDETCITSNQTYYACSDDTDCDDTNDCSADTCLNGTCQYQSIIPCCGNGDCEANEDYNACPEDCRRIVPENPVFHINVDSPARVTRGTTIEFSATIQNLGLGTAFNVRPYWMLPDGLQLIATNDDCDVLLPDAICTITGQVYIEPKAIGRQEIRILVDYE
jgi:hypothetical protein